MRMASTVILLLFVASSIGFLVVSEARNASSDAQSGTAAPDMQLAASPAAQQGASAVAYYFHGTMRCPTCLKIERLSRESIEGAFAAELNAGLIEWRSIDYDQPGNAHFVEDYGLSASALILVDRSGDADWRKLDKTWELVDDEPAFKDYVVEAVSNLLRGKP